MNPERLNFKIVFLALSCLIPCAVFASVWNGSDVERYSPAVPFTSIAIVYGLSYFSPLSIKGILPARIPLNCLFATFVITANIGTFILPRLIGESALTVQLGRKASEHMHSGDLLVVTGQDLWAPIKSATEYLYGIKVHNIHFLVSGYGPRDWEQRLERALSDCFERQCTVAVLADFKGRPTPGGIGLIKSEYPEPSMDSIVEFFEKWNELKTWNVGGYEFVVVEPPDIKPTDQL